MAENSNGHKEAERKKKLIRRSQSLEALGFRIKIKKKKTTLNIGRRTGHLGKAIKKKSVKPED